MLTSHVFLLKPTRAINHMLRMMALTIYAPSRNARISALVFELNNPVPVSLLSGDRKPQIRFLGNHHSGSGNLYHKSFRM